MPPLDHAAAHQKADQQLFNAEADKIIGMQNAGCKILNEVIGMSDADVKAVFAAAHTKTMTDSSHPPSIHFHAETYSERQSGYGYAPTTYVPRVLASVETFVPNVGFTNIMNYDSGKVNNDGIKPGTCTDRK